MLVPWLVAIALMGCGEAPTTVEAPASGDDGPHAHELFAVNDQPISPSAQVVLVAGSSEGASFAQEVVDQRQLWLDAGVPPEAIACYYVVPYEEELVEDRAQYEALAAQLASCHRASVHRLRHDLTAIAEQPEPPEHLYLFVTSHGERPATDDLAEMSITDAGYWRVRRYTRFEPLNKHRLMIEGLPDGTAGPAQLLGAYRGGMDPDDVFLTPGGLARTLAAFPPETVKTVVLQGCYSGGFAVPGGPTAQVPSLTLLAASQPDRPSFGCDTGRTTTYYGGALNRLLAQRARPPEHIDWEAVHGEVSSAVTALEADEQEEPSLPMLLRTPKP